jgi:CRISPR/Cas system-associated exonuclease Cas4 (RecB family)
MASGHPDVTLPAKLTPSPEAIASLTPSLTEDLRTCKLRLAFRLDPHYKVAPTRSPQSALGTVVHSIAELAAKGAFDNLDPLERATRVDAIWGEHIASQANLLKQQSPLGEPPPPERWPGHALAKNHALRITARRPSRAKTPRATASVHADLEAEVDIESRELRLHGRIDLIEAGAQLEITDLKTGVEYGDEIKPPHRRQLLLYAALLRATRGELPSRVNVQRGNGRRVTLQVDAAEVDELVEDTQRLLVDYEAETRNRVVPATLATPSAEGCRTCNYRGTCAPMFQAATPDWGWRNPNVLGTVTSSDSSASVRLCATAGTIKPGDISLSGQPEGVVLPGHGVLAVIDAEPTMSPTAIRASWRTQIWRWPEPQPPAGPTTP